MVGSALVRLGHSLARVKIWGCRTLTKFKGQCSPKVVHTLSAPLSTTSRGKILLGYSLLALKL